MKSSTNIADMKRVVITGMGWVTPMGQSIESVWKKLLAGDSGIGKTSLFDAHTFPTRIGAEVKDFTLEEHVPDAEAHAGAGRNTQFALASCAQAWKAAKLDSNTLDLDRVGIYFASGEGSLDFDSYTNAALASYSAEASAIDAKRWGGSRRRPDECDSRSRAGAEHGLTASGDAHRRTWTGVQLSHRLCRQRAGDRRSHRNSPPRRRRRDDLRRRALDDPSAGRHRLHPPHSAERRQRRAAESIAAVRSSPRRLRTRRRRGRRHSRNARTRTGTRRAHPRGGRRLWLNGGCVSHHRSAPRRHRRCRRDAGGARRRAAVANGCRLHRRPRHRHARETTATKPARSNKSLAKRPRTSRRVRSKA